MNNSEKFLYTVYFLAIVVHFLSIVNTSLFVIPLQIQQNKVKDGLKVLRRYLLGKGFLSLMLDAAAILALSSRFIMPFGEVSRYIIVTLVFAHASVGFSKSIIDSRIYHEQYEIEVKAQNKRDKQARK